MLVMGSLLQVATISGKICMFPMLESSSGSKMCLFPVAGHLSFVRGHHMCTTRRDPVVRPAHGGGFCGR